MAKYQGKPAAELRAPAVATIPVGKGLVCPFLTFLPEVTDGRLSAEDFQSDDPCRDCLCSGLIGG